MDFSEFEEQAEILYNSLYVRCSPRCADCDLCREINGHNYCLYVLVYGELNIIRNNIISNTCSPSEFRKIIVELSHELYCCEDCDKCATMKHPDFPKSCLSVLINEHWR